MASSDVELCRRNYWGPGTLLVGTEGQGEPWEETLIIELRYVGEDVIVAKPIESNGVPIEAKERAWTLSCRKWEVFEEPW